MRVAVPYPGFVRTASNNQSKRSEFYKYTRLPVTNWVEKS